MPVVVPSLPAQVILQNLRSQSAELLPRSLPRCVLHVQADYPVLHVELAAGVPSDLGCHLTWGAI